MLFKILHGDVSRISTEITPFHEGYCYVTHDGFMYIDMNIGTEETPNNQRIKLNASQAESLIGYDIATILNSSDLEIPTSKSVKTYVDNAVANSGGGTDVEASETNGNIKINGEEVTVYEHPAMHNGTEVYITSADSQRYSSNTLNGAIGAIYGDIDEKVANASNWELAYGHSLSTHAPADAEANVIETVEVNGVAQTVTNKTVNIQVQDGYTPVKGIDYWTDADKAEIKSYVDDAILNGEW